jgi:hypothetical protein
MTRYELVSRRIYDRKKEKEVRLFIQSLKNKPCADCGNSFHPAVMEFDHLRDKKFTISKKPSKKSRRKLLDEISKCEIVCANCHRMRTVRRKELKILQPKNQEKLLFDL